MANLWAMAHVPKVALWPKVAYVDQIIKERQNIFNSLYNLRSTKTKIKVKTVLYYFKKQSYQL